jgi:predicted O-methyltransferase YrrM
MTERYIKFLHEIGQLPIKVGSINLGQRLYLMAFLQSHPEIHTVLETGFHSGISAATFLEARSDIEVISFDIFWFDYTRKAKLLLDKYYPDRNLLLAGNSIVSLPMFFKYNTKPIDMVFVDGGHEAPIPLLDLRILLTRVRPGTYIIIDDYCKQHGSHGVVDAVDTIVREGYLTKIEILESYDRGWLIAQRSTKEENPFEVPSKTKQTVLSNIDSHYS